MMQDGKIFNENVALFFISWFNKSSEVYKAAPVRDFNSLFNSTLIETPITPDGCVDTPLINAYVSAYKKILQYGMKDYWQSIINSI